MTAPARKDGEAGTRPADRPATDEAVESQTPAVQSPPQLEASEPVETPQPELPADARLAALEGRARSRQERDAGRTQAKPAPEPVASEVPEPDALPLRRAPGEPWKSEEDDQWYVTTNVYGELKDTPLAKALADAEKVAGADAKFRRASEMLRAAEGRDAQRPADVKPVALPEKKPDESPQFTPESIDKALFSEDEDGQKARQAMAERLSNPTPAADPAEIARQVTESLRAERIAEAEATERQQYAERVESAKGEIAKDPWIAEALNDLEGERAQIINRYSQVLLNDEPSLDPLENLQKASRLARVYLGEPEVPAVDPMAERREQKAASAASLVSGQSMRVPVGHDAPPPPTLQQKRAQMRQRRGLQ